MSIAEKLTTIAENEQRVYEAGKAEGEKKADSKPYINTEDPNFDMRYFCAEKSKRYKLFPYINFDVIRDFFHCFSNHSGLTVIDIPTPAATFVNSYCYGCKTVVEVKNLNTSKCENVGYMFNNASALESVNELDFSSVINSTNAFSGCTSLKNITFKENTINISISFKSCTQLTLNSAKSIIKGLVDYKGTANESAYTLNLAAETVALLEADGNTSPNNNSWIEYIADKGWNI